MARVLFRNGSDVEIINGQRQRTAFFFFIVCLLVATMVVVLPGWLPLIAFVASAIIAFLAYRPDLGLILLAFLSPFTGLVVDFGAYEWSRNVPYLGGIDAPVLDFFAMALFVALLIRIIVSAPRITKQMIRPAPMLGLFLLFLFANVLSLFFAPNSEYFLYGLKFLLRPLLFMYLMFVVIPNVIIQSEQLLIRVLRAFFFSGVLAAIMGLASFLVVGPFGGLWHRATPFAIGGFAPLGYNHNLLAEVLVLMVPLGVYFVYQEHVEWKRRWYFLATALIALIALLTFARTAWIVLGFEFFLFVWFFRKEIRTSAIMRHSKRLAILGVTVLLPVLIYMAAITSSRLVAGSTDTRLDLTLIAWEYFKRSPWVGNGPGSFMHIVSDTHVFFIEYGDPLDAHGMLQKVLAEGGIIGLAAWVGLLAAIVAYCYHALVVARRRRGEEGEERSQRMAALCIMVLGAMVYQLFNTSYFNAKMWLPIGLALVASQFILCKKEKSKSSI